HSMESVVRGPRSNKGHHDLPRIIPGVRVMRLIERWRRLRKWLTPDRRPHPVRRRLEVESLEQRDLLSVSSTFAGTPFLTAGTDVNVSQLPYIQNEATVAVNPANPANLIAFATDQSGSFSRPFPNPPLDVAYFSRDAGRTWTPTAVPDAEVGPYVPGKPALAFDRAGNALLAHETTVLPEGHVVLERSRDGGQTWTTYVVFDANPVGLAAFKPMIAVGPDPINPNQDNVYVAYTVHHYW